MWRRRRKIKLWRKRRENKRMEQVGKAFLQWLTNAARQGITSRFSDFESRNKNSSHFIEDFLPGLFANAIPLIFVRGIQTIACDNSMR